MSSGALLKPDAFKRAAVIDAELGWPRGLAIGRLAMLYAAVQEGKGRSVAKKRLILEWACVPPEEGDAFIALCCKVSEHDEDDHIHFLEHRGDDRYFVVGNPKQLEKIATFKERASAGGKAKAAKVAAKREAKSQQPPASSSASSTTPSTASSTLEAVPQEVLNACPLPYPFPLPCPSPLPTSPLPPQAGAEADGGDDSLPVKPPTPRKLRETAKTAAVSIERVLYSGADDHAAHAALTPFARHLVRIAFGGHDFTDGWGRLMRRAERAVRDKSEQPFLYGLRRDFAAVAEEAWLATQKPREIEEHPHHHQGA